VDQFTVMTLQDRNAFRDEGSVPGDHYEFDMPHLISCKVCEATVGQWVSSTREMGDPQLHFPTQRMITPFFVPSFTYVFQHKHKVILRSSVE
jgi:hypothetical protein